MLVRQLDALLHAPAEGLPGALRDLFAVLPGDGGAADGGAADGGAADAAAVLTGALPTLPAARRPHVVLALGLLADGEDPDVLAVLGKAVPAYLALLPGAGRPLSRALLHLLGHFPEHRARIVEACRDAGAGPGELSRLERSLADLDPAAPVIGRVWPAPLAWPLSARESAGHLEWARSLPAAAVAAAWRNDTRTLHAYAGARALWAAESGRDAPATTSAPGPTPPAPPAAPVPRPAAGSGPARWDRFAGTLCCPHCRSPLAGEGGGARCTGCAAVYDARRGQLDVGADGGPGEAMARVAAAHYESALRPAVLRLTGGNWDGALTPDDEDRYLRASVRPAPGPVVDVGCGPGRWTAVLAAAFGQDRVIALDSSPAMLDRVGALLPDVLRIRGDALRLPFTDASVGAVNCWNTLQALPDPALAITEAARCLRPGGTFTLLTFRPSPDPVYAHFQRRLTVATFDPGEVVSWLTAAGLTVTDTTTPGTLLLLTATRNPDRTR
ncbi:class I SAM-dependent methyltransferase [Streptomyces xiamenensis]